MWARRASSALLVGLLLAPWLEAGRAEAAPRRVALVVGQNRGLETERPLRYAEDDARRVAAVLETLGDFDAVELLLDPDAEAVSRRVEGLAAQAELLFFYYSGHAGAGRLHLAGTELDGAQLLSALEGRDAELTVSVLDACASGDLTVAKGLKIDLEAPPAPTPTVRGRALLASSSPGEAAQESAALRASFFSAHLVTGLRGAADADADGVVSLREVYRYAYDRTVGSTLVSAAGVQRPSYDVRLSGRSDVPLTWTGRAGAHLTLAAQADGRFFVLDTDESVLLAEVPLSAGGSARLALEPGAYVVKKRGARGLSVAQVDLQPGRDARLDERDMERVPYAALRDKGERRRELLLTGRLATGLAGVDALGGLGVGYLTDLGPLTLGPSVGVVAGAQGGALDVFSIVTDPGVFVGLTRPGARWRLWYGLRPALLVAHQRVSGRSARTSLGFAGYVSAGISAWLGDDVGVVGGVEVGAAGQRVTDDPLADTARFDVGFSAALSLGLRFRS